ncbi:hypothetical protein ACFRKB_20465 [Streptomyces scopuliridis]|uniref:hypothetical protein n=1 Tax=Streptomyces scopuliridis TaxID=452529 RepID=UPI00369AF06C
MTSTWPKEPLTSAAPSSAPTSAGLTALPTKTQSSESRIALLTPCLRPLEQHRNRQLQEREAAGAGWKDSGYVFTRPDGAPIEGSTLTRHFNTLLRQALSLQSHAIDTLGNALNPTDTPDDPPTVAVKHHRSPTKNKSWWGF